MNTNLKSIFIPHHQKIKDKNRGLRIILFINLLFFGFCSVMVLMNIVQATVQTRWMQTGLAQYLYNTIFVGSIIFFFCLILRLYWSKRPFHSIMAKGMRILGIILLSSSFIIPRLPDYTPRLITFMQYNDFVLADAIFLFAGMILLLISFILEYGCQFQQEVDTML